LATKSNVASTLLLVWTGLNELSYVDWPVVMSDVWTRSGLYWLRPFVY